MDDYVLRGDAAAALAASLVDAAPPASQKKRQRQTTIHHGHKVVSEERTAANMLSILDALERLFISLEMLEKTRIGVALTRLSRRAESPEVQGRAKKLLKLWKTRAKKAMRRRKRRVETYGRNYAD
ncbi:Transcription factor IIS, N-terminal [Phytophthora cactorum]|nr:Transcription factor IIS, N-terminal [Phytophthora cactorum]KAF1776551.1 Transcription factor IIS, N-terminal [Phytophthora cactorum]